MSDPNTEQPQILDQAVPADAPMDTSADTSVETSAMEPEAASQETPQADGDPVAPAGPELPALSQGEDYIPLPSGVVCIMRPGKGRDLLAAQRVAGSDPHQIMYGLIASLCTFDGQKKVLEDVLEMPLGDVMKLTGKIGDQAGGDFLPSTSGQSSTSQP